MAITLRAVTGSALSHNQLDTNFSSYFYSASISASVLSLHYTGSSTIGLLPRSSSITVPNSSKWTDIAGGGISRNSIVQISGSTSITGSTNIFGNLTQGEFGLQAYNFSHAQGSQTIASASYSHAEGRQTATSGAYSHAEGRQTSTALSGEYSHAEGYLTIASGAYSHTEGQSTIARGLASHAEGFGTVAIGSYQHVQGQYNASSSVQSAFIVGNGVSDGSRSNLVFAAGSTVQVTGSLQVSGSITGSLFGTASWASNTISSSFAISSTYPFAVTGSSIYSTVGGAPSQLNANGVIAIGGGGGLGTGTDGSVFIGSAFTGYQAPWSTQSVFIGTGAGQYAVSGSESVFIGWAAGGNTVNAQYSNFFGNRAGRTTSASFSNFFGQEAGSGATNASYSNFLGRYAGGGATNANRSNFIGPFAGEGATAASYSNFIGDLAGRFATAANNSNFIGPSAGLNATTANNSNFLGGNAGNAAVSASYSNLLGYNAGYNIGSLSIGSNNIIIGTNITLAAQQKDSINLGGIIFATGSYSTTGGNPFSGSVTGARVGIGTSTPAHTLDISGSLRTTSNVQITGSLNILGAINAVGDLTVQGNIIAQQYIVSSSVYYVTESFSSGSHIFGNSLDDTHQFTGSVLITGSSTIRGTQTIAGNTVYTPGTTPAFNGEIVRFGAGTLAQGQLYFLSSSGTWSLANANSTGSSIGMLGIAVGSSPTTDGLLIRGFSVSSSYNYGTGSVVYMATGSGTMTGTSPSSSNHVVRVMGYQTSLSNTIYFDPDKTWVTLA